jgi:aspartyl/asparaginyl beta-hydroxylase (cupin superfamily)/Tfp pilus assembly protein PilF
MSADENTLRALIGAAEAAIERGNFTDARKSLSDALAAAPSNPEVFSAAGNLILRCGDPPAAQALMGQAIALEPRNPRFRVNLAHILRVMQEPAAELQALDEALALDPYYYVANLQKGALLELQGKQKSAAGAYHAALSSLRPGTPIPNVLQPVLERAQRTVRANFQALEDYLQERMKDVRARHSGEAQDRIDDCLAIFVGRKRVYNQQPTMTHFPGLPAISFFDRKDFPWIVEVEAATQDIRGELESLLATSLDDFSPYVKYGPETPLNQWRDLNNSRRWSALFLYQDGKRIEQNIARCPLTVAALARAPLVDIPARAPTAFFSRLEPKTRIPAHTGSSNTRLTVHIPLVIQPDCGFRVGSEVRTWELGKALIFDDTIEHEAWNESDQPRVVMIFDIWNPLLSAAERDLMSVATAGIAEYFDAP